MLLVEALHAAGVNSELFKLSLRRQQNMFVLSFICPSVCRAFRLHLSSKAGKSSHLRPTARYGNLVRTPEQIFFDCLVTTITDGISQRPVSLLRMHSIGGDLQLQSSKGGIVNNTVHLNVSASSCEQSCCSIDITQLPSEWTKLLLVQQQQQQQHCGIHGHRDDITNMLQRGGADNVEAQYGPSPFPLLETFIQSVCNQVSWQWQFFGTTPKHSLQL